MKKVYLYGALLILGTLGLSASAAAKDHYQGHGQYHHNREIRHDDHARHDYRDHDGNRDRWRSERHERERHEWAERREHERREWAQNHRHHSNHYGWQRGTHNLHEDANWKQPAPATYGPRPTRPVASSTPSVARSYPTRPTRGSVQTHNR